MKRRRGSKGESSPGVPPSYVYTCAPLRMGSMVRPYCKTPHFFCPCQKKRGLPQRKANMPKNCTGWRGLSGPPPPCCQPHGIERRRSGRGGEKGGRATIPPSASVRAPRVASGAQPGPGCSGHGQRSNGGARQRRQAKTGGKRGRAPMPPCFAEGGTPFSGVNGGTSEGRINRPKGNNRGRSSRRGIRERPAKPILSARPVLRGKRRGRCRVWLHGSTCTAL